MNNLKHLARWRCLGLASCELYFLSWLMAHWNCDSRDSRGRLHLERGPRQKASRHVNLHFGHPAIEMATARKRSNKSKDARLDTIYLLSQTALNQNDGYGYTHKYLSLSLHM